ncbi:MAG: peroxiredoxin [Candidatus Sericytochromatia bacterium]|nr:peroxiredoxin [Candidatus Tanganyikabacteria bacterium]
MKAFTADYEKFQQVGAEILGVSQDQVGTQRKFRIHCATPFPLLSDAGGKVARAYGVAMPVIGVSRRVTFLIDRQGVVRHVADGMPDDAALLEVLASWDLDERKPDVGKP